MMMVQWVMVDGQVVFVSGQHAGGWVDGTTSGLLLACHQQTVEIELVHVALAVHFGHNVFVVVISDGREEKIKTIIFNCMNDYDSVRPRL